MYIPAHFAAEDLASLDGLARHDAFGTLVSVSGGAPYASHLPVLYRREGGQVTLTGHWARPNPQWQDIEGQRVLFIFHGPHAYVSARWYEEPRRNVPTWNYAVAHLYGSMRLIREPSELESLVQRLADQFEGDAPGRWTYEATHGRPQLRGIVGFELRADELQVKLKLNQNHPAVNVRGVIDGLRGVGTDDALATAGLMEQALHRRPPPGGA
jgi:transcriptional regulator